MSDAIKSIAKSIKAAGLQRLRWYCQMCAKQCRDENGFKCHCLSENHLRQMELFRQNPMKFIEQFSIEFEKSFLEILRRKGGRYMKANEIYQEQISDREHIRMNSTKWESLTSFCQYLGKSNSARVSQDEKGIFWVQYKSPTSNDKLSSNLFGIIKSNEIINGEEEIIRKRIAAALKQAENKNQENQSDTEEESAEPTTAASAAESAPSDTPNPLPVAAPIRFGLTSSNQNTVKSATEVQLLFSNSIHESRQPNSNSALPMKRKSSALESVMAENEAMKARAKAAAERNLIAENQFKLFQAQQIQTQSQPQQIMQSPTNLVFPPTSIPSNSSTAVAPLPLVIIPDSTWLIPGLIVKIISTSPYKDQKCVIDKVEFRSGSPFAVIRLSVGGPEISFAETELETVLPPVNQRIRIVSGPNRGEIGVLTKIDEEEFVCDVKLLNGKLIEKLEFEEICKF